MILTCKSYVLKLLYEIKRLDKIYNALIIGNETFMDTEMKDKILQ
jgi:hypothetical protein